MTSLRRLVRSAHRKGTAAPANAAHLKRIDERLDRVEDDLRVLAFDVEAIQQRDQAEHYPDKTPSEQEP